MAARVKEIQVRIPEYLYEEASRLTAVGIFKDFSSLVEAGIRHELESRQLLEPEFTTWQEGVAQLRAHIHKVRAEKGYRPKSKEEIIDELRAIRREIWEEEYQEQYTGHPG